MVDLLEETVDDKDQNRNAEFYFQFRPRDVHGVIEEEKKNNLITDSSQD